MEESLGYQRCKPLYEHLVPLLAIFYFPGDFTLILYGIRWETCVGNTFLIKHFVRINYSSPYKSVGDKTHPPWGSAPTELMKYFPSTWILRPQTTKSKKNKKQKKNKKKQNKIIKKDHNINMADQIDKKNVLLHPLKLVIKSKMSLYLFRIVNRIDRQPTWKKKSSKMFLKLIKGIVGEKSTDLWRQIRDIHRDHFILLST